MVQSFMIDHTKLNPGIYVSRTDKLEHDTITTIDIRICKPNNDMLSPAVSHTIEHLMANYMRNDSIYKDSVVYFGPMGCLTGFYLILKGSWSSKTICPEIAKAFLECSNAKSIPGASEKECGNYRLNDLVGATLVCKKFSTYLQKIQKKCLEYSK